MMDGNSTKSAALVLMAALTLVVSLFPLYLRRVLLRKIHSATSQIILSGCLCFGAGVLMATVFLHLLPETKETYDHAMNVGYMVAVDYPLAELIMCIGFFFVYLVEEVIHSCLNTHEQQQEQDVLATPGGTRDNEDVNKAKIMTSVKRKKHPSIECNVTGVELQTNEAFDDDEHITPAPENECSEQSAHTTPHIHHHVSGLNKSTSVMEAVVVVIALSFHSIMEGLAIGLESNIADVWILFGAVVAHKFVIAFCISMELLEVRLSFKPFMASIVIFSLASPIGGFIGVLLLSLATEETSANVLIPNVLQSISAGTILYVAFCEVLERERAKNERGLVRLLALFAGFCVMAGLQCLDKDGENLKKMTTTLPFPSSIVAV
nr:zinc transporter ZIP1-like [Cherax quadricarinatus]